ncbi:MAG: KEOPS complex subunit Cgi121 [Candidatus Bathyarchaeales archaeon]
MLKRIEEFGKYVLIAGLKGIKIRETDKFLKKFSRESLGVEIQFFDAHVVAGWQHIYFAVLNALTAFKNKRNVSKSLAMETLLYASAQRQIKKSLKNVGIKPKTTEVALAIIGDKPETLKSALNMVVRVAKAKRDDKVLALTEEKIGGIREIFGISDLELEAVMEKDDLKKALADIVMERMALLATQV